MSNSVYGNANFNLTNPNPVRPNHARASASSSNTFNLPALSQNQLQALRHAEQDGLLPHQSNSHGELMGGSGGGGGGGGLDMNMGMLPMDLDDIGMDLSAATANAVSNPAPFSAEGSFSPAIPMPNNGMTSQGQPMSMAAASGGMMSGPYGGENQQGQQQQQQQGQQGEKDQKPQPGAGPPPLALPPGTTHSTLTEFTKRRNWSQRIIEELRDFLHILTPDGRLLYASPSCRAITGHEPQSLIGKLIGEFVHPDDTGIFMREFNESIASGNTLRFFYRFKKDDGTYIILECDGHPHISPKDPSAYGQLPNQQNQSQVLGVCRGFFMMARPYPTKNAALLDSFLEHKIENERLLKRIDELKREEAVETAEQDRLYREHISSTPLTGASGSSSPMPPTHQQTQNPSASPAHATSPTTDYQGMPPPAKPTVSNTALTRQNLDSALSSQRPDSIADKMSRYEANAGHLESIELLTGLRYRDGERSHGISTGDTSPALIRGDAGIAILLDRDRDAAAKKDKKKLKVADEYVCADCGTLDSPEWRKGPKGPKTLCNACGLRWAKKEKKRDEGRSPQQGGGQVQQVTPQPPPTPPGQPNFGGMGHLTAPGVPGLPAGESGGSG